MSDVTYPDGGTPAPGAVATPAPGIHEGDVDNPAFSAEAILAAAEAAAAADAEANEAEFGSMGEPAPLPEAPAAQTEPDEIPEVPEAEFEHLVQDEGWVEESAPEPEPVKKPAKKTAAKES